MDQPLSNMLKTTFLVHWIISAALGAVLFLIPGRTLTALGWVPQWATLPEVEQLIPGTMFVDPVLIRLLGVALLALAWASFRGWRAEQFSQVSILVQMEAVFCILGLVGMIAGFVMSGRSIPVIGYILMVILALFAIAWSLALRRT